MDRESLIAAVLKKADGAVAGEATTQLPEVTVPLERFRGFMEQMKADTQLALDYPMSMTAVDWPEAKKITCVYHLYSFTHGHKLVVKCDVDREKASIATVSDLWRGCEWFEREVFDLFGVVFEEHPDLRRIMTTDDWVGFPLRKDYKDSRIAGKPY